MRCLHGVIGFCIACTIAAAFPAGHVDRDHDHPDPARVEYVGSPAFVVQPSSNVVSASTTTPWESLALASSSLANG